MRVLSYNIHKGIGGRDRRYQLDRILAVFDHEKPDIVCLQEVDRNVKRSKFDNQPELIAEHIRAIGKLFQNGRALGTVLLWTAFFMCLFMVYALSSWLTKLMAGAGYTLGSALTFVLVLNFGAMIGAIAGGWLADRFNINRVLASMYALAAVSISLLGMHLPTWALFIVVGLAGASTIGTQILTYAYAGQFYPSSIRSTGIGWASGVGRSGAILAPIIIGILVEMALPLSLNFVAIALPAVVATIAVLVMNRSRPDESAPGQAGAQREIGAVSPLPAAGER